MESPRHDVSKGATPKQDISPKKSGNPGTSSSSSDKRQTLIKNTKQLFGARMNSPKVGKYFKHLVFLISSGILNGSENKGQIRSHNLGHIAPYESSCLVQ